MEKRDLYDSNKVLTGEFIYKGDIVPKDKYYLTVVVIIQNSSKKFLIQNNMKYNKWSFTGGHPKSGESSIDGIVSEINEELGIVVFSNELKLIDTIKTNDDFIDIYYLNKDINLNDISMQLDEVSEVLWVDKILLDEMIRDGLFLSSHIEFYNIFKCYDII